MIEVWLHQKDYKFLQKYAKECFAFVHKIAEKERSVVLYIQEGQQIEEFLDDLFDASGTVGTDENYDITKIGLKIEGIMNTIYYHYKQCGEKNIQVY